MPPIAAVGPRCGAGQQIVRASLTQDNRPGTFGGGRYRGETVWRKGWVADLRRARPSRRITVPIGTASTALTAAAAGVLLADGRLKLDDEIHDVLACIPQEQWPVTVRELMGHTAGVIDDEDEGDPF